MPFHQLLCPPRIGWNILIHCILIAGLGFMSRHAIAWWAFHYHLCGAQFPTQLAKFLLNCCVTMCFLVWIRCHCISSHDHLELADKYLIPCILHPGVGFMYRHVYYMVAFLFHTCGVPNMYPLFDNLNFAAKFVVCGIKSHLGFFVCAGL